MSKVLVYTFKNFPFKDSIAQFQPFEFHKLNADLVVFAQIINEIKPTRIIGIAKSPSNVSRFETQTINEFNKVKKVSKLSREKYSLDYPQNGYKSISLNRGATDSFCNWTMYKVSQIIENRSIKFQFIHIAKSDLIMLEEYMSSL